MDKPPPHCECDRCYLYVLDGDNSVMCDKGRQIQKQWTEYYKRRRFEAELRIEREKHVISPAELKAREREKEKARRARAEAEGGKEKAIIVREKASDPKDRFYNFIFYASLLYILTLKLKWDIESP